MCDLPRGQESQRKWREEEDSIGTVHVPADAYYGAQTARAVENFQISGLTFPRPFIKALGLIKKHAARVNRDLGLLDSKPAEAIIAAAERVADGSLDDQFVVDVFQTGSRTSTNMNANEVIASAANERLTGARGGKSPVHPNDHINLGQSSNDVIPTAIHLAAVMEIEEVLVPALALLHEKLAEKEAAFHDVPKIGRTHLQDAVPMTLGQEFGGYARQVELAWERINDAENGLFELALGGTAVGTGLNTHPGFAPLVIAALAEETGFPFEEAVNHFAAQAAQDAAVSLSAALRTCAVSLTKIANDIRWLSSGPRCGLGELSLPALQPGSSIMPGKVNPVIPEAVLQTAAQVTGNDAAVALAGQSGIFELNVMLPVIAYNVLQSIHILAGAALVFAEKCIAGLTANRERCTENVEKSLAMVTALVPRIGYDRAAALAKEAGETGKTVRQVALEKEILPEEELAALFDGLTGLP